MYNNIKDILEMEKCCTINENDFQEFWNETYKDYIIHTFGKEQPYKEIAWNSFQTANYITRRKMIKFVRSNLLKGE